MGYQITNIEYGIGPWGTEFVYGMVGNPKPGETEQNVHSVTVIQGEGHNILVDTGVDTEDPAKGKLWGELITQCKGVVWALAQIGLAPDDIDTVILTHAHIDHIGGLLRFPHARVFIQQKEFEAWESLVTDPRYAQLTLPAAMASDYPPIRELIEEGAVTLLNGDVVNLYPGIDLHVAYNCHSVAEQVVVVDNATAAQAAGSHVVVSNEQGQKVVVPHPADPAKSARDVYVIAGDLALRPANLLGSGDWKGFLAPILGRSGSALNVMRAYEWILEQTGGDMRRLVLTHDSTMGERFESEQTEDGLQIHYVVR